MAVNLNLETLQFSPTSVLTITLIPNGDGASFNLYVKNSDTNNYYIEVKPKISGTVDTTITLVKFDVLGTNSGSATKPITNSVMYLLNKSEINRLCNNSSEVTFDIHLDIIRNYDNAYGIYETSYSYKLDNSDFTYSSNPTITSLSTTVNWAVDRLDSDGIRKILFPVNGYQGSLYLSGNIVTSRNLDAPSKNYYKHYLSFHNLSETYNYVPLLTSRPDLTDSSNTTTKPFTIDNPLLKSSNKTELIGNLYKPKELYTELIGSNKHIDNNGITMWTNYNPKRIYAVSASNDQVRTWLIYGWQHMYDFNTTKVYWSDSLNMVNWQNNAAATLKVDVVATADSNFKIGGSLNYDFLPWPKIQYKVKVYTKNVNDSIQAITNLKFDDYGYSTYHEIYQSYLAKLYATTYDSSAYNFVYTTTASTAASSVSDTVTIAAATLGGFPDDTEFHVYIVTLDELGFYQAVYLNKGMNEDGKLLYSPYRGHS